MKTKTVPKPKLKTGGVRSRSERSPKVVKAVGLQEDTLKTFAHPKVSRNLGRSAGFHEDTAETSVSADQDPTSADEDAASADSAPILELGVAYTVDRHFVTNPETQNPIGKPIEFDHVTIIELHEKTVLVKDGMTNKTHTLTDESFAHIKPLQILSRASRKRVTTAPSQQDGAPKGFKKERA